MLLDRGLDRGERTGDDAVYARGVHGDVEPSVDTPTDGNGSPLCLISAGMRFLRGG